MSNFCAPLQPSNEFGLNKAACGIVLVYKPWSDGLDIGVGKTFLIGGAGGTV